MSTCSKIKGQVNRVFAMASRKEACTCTQHLKTNWLCTTSTKTLL